MYTIMVIIHFHTLQTLKLFFFLCKEKFRHQFIHFYWYKIYRIEKIVFAHKTQFFTLNLSVHCVKKYEDKVSLLENKFPKVSYKRNS